MKKILIGLIIGSSLFTITPKAVTLLKAERNTLVCPEVTVESESLIDEIHKNLKEFGYYNIQVSEIRKGTLYNPLIYTINLETEIMCELSENDYYRLVNIVRMVVDKTDKNYDVTINFRNGKYNNLEVLYYGFNYYINK